MIKKLLKKIFGKKEKAPAPKAARPAGETERHEASRGQRAVSRREKPRDQEGRERGHGAHRARQGAPERRERGGAREERGARAEGGAPPESRREGGRRSGGGGRAEGRRRGSAAAQERPPRSREGVAERAAERAAERPAERPAVRREARERHRESRAEPAAVPLPELPPLPPWSPPGDPTRFDAYDLPEPVRAGIRDAGFETCTPVQAQVLPLSLDGRDVAAQSQTGTGKTAAFLITIYARLLRRGPVAGPKPRALVIAPTRELAVQIESDARLLGAHTGLSATVVFGGVDYEKQRAALRAGADVVIGTPGRLIDYLKQGAWRPEGVEILVVDEADRMFDMGFIRDLRYILRRLPPYERRLSMLFSATLNWRVMELTYEYMNLPAEVRATPEKMTAERAEEVLYHVAREEKAALLLGLLQRERPERTLIFTNTKIEAEKVARLLEHHGVRGRGITGNLEQARRLKLMEEFRGGRLPILVATDVASRGLHIDNVTHVVNWDLPQDPEDYVHRIGRTARAGAAGKAISFADESGAYNLEAIEKLIGYKIPVTWHETSDLAEVTHGWERRPREEREGRARGGDRTGGRGGSGRGGGRSRGGREGRPRGGGGRR